MPTLVVEIAFGSTWEDASPTWTDVSSYVRKASWKRGRSDELDKFSAGTARVILDNKDRRFDPLYSSGPYYGDLKPMTPIRIRALHNATYYPRFYGYIDALPQKYDRGNTDATCEISATDAFKILANLSMPDEYETAVLADDPAAYFPMGESGAKAIDKSGWGLDGTWAGVAPQDSMQEPLRSFSQGYSTRFYTTGGNLLAPLAYAAGAATIECWLKVDEGTLDGSTFWAVLANSATAYSAGFAIEIEGNAPTYVRVRNTASNNTYYFEYDIDDGQVHHVVVLGGTSSVPRLFIDAVEYFHSSSSLGPTWGYPQGFYTGGGNLTAFNGFMSDAALYAAHLTPEEIAEHYEAASNPWYGDTTGTRIERILGAIGWPTGNQSIDAGSQLLGSSVEGGKVLEAFQSLAQAEQGRFFVEADGKITFHQRGRFASESTESTVQATFSDDGSDNPYAQLTFSYDDTFIYNIAEVERTGGVRQVSVDASSQMDYGPKTVSLTGLRLQNDKAAKSLADYLVYRYNSAEMRVDEFEPRPTTTGQWTETLTLKIGYRINVERTPQDVGSAIDLDCHIESIKEEVTPDDWRITFTASPADDNIYFVWGGSEGWGDGAWL